MRVVLADGHHLFREGLRAVLEEAGVSVVGETQDTAAAAMTARALRPDVVVLGVDELCASHADTVREIVAACPSAKVLVLASSAEPEQAIAVLAAGSASHLLKDLAPDELVGGICQSAAGSSVLSSSTLQALLEQLDLERRDSEPGGSPDLTARELDVLRGIADGFDNAEIGRALSISPHTVKHHVTSILEKLGARTRVEAAVRATRRGLI